ncbi:MAG: 30S ribosomal protein S8 [Schleiferiaceae bacterium]|jgi:small subunit ribosomal protein S8
MHADPVSDYLTRVRNAVRAGHKTVEIPASKLKLEITKILKDQGYVLNYKVDDSSAQGVIKIALKYDRVTKVPAIRNLERVSKPGLRKYAHTDVLPRVKNGLGVAIISTSHGVMTDKQARKEHVGGEVLCYVY